MHPIHVQLVFKRPVFLYGFFVVYLLRQFSCFFVSPFLLRYGVFCLYCVKLLLCVKH